MPNRADLFTGKFTFTYLGWAPLPPKEKTLAEILYEAGYITIGVVDTPFFIRKGYNYDQGFKDFLWVSGQGAERPRIDFERRYEEDFCAPKTMLAAEKFLEYYRKDKFFLYVDTWDPHEPWDPPSWYVEPYYPGYAGEVVHPCYWDWHEFGLKEEDVNLAHACYCGEVTMVDFWVGRLLDKVESLGILDNTMILFTSDHGFYFGEHGYFGKGRLKPAYWYQESGQQWEDAYFAGEKLERGFAYHSPLYQEITRVPLLIYISGVNSRRIGAMVSSVDLMPTILELANAEIPETVQGESLLSLIEGRRETLHDFVVTSWPLYSLGQKTRAVDHLGREIKEISPSTITTENWTLLYATEDYPVELYNIERDPNQCQNVSHENREVAKDLHHKFIQFLEQAGTSERYLAPRRRLGKL
jgi:arylsulfatase A-like enzyme